MATNDLDLAWAAGFFDGEGSIGVYARHGESGYSLSSSVAQVERPPLDRLRAIFGGTVRPMTARGNQSPSWRLDWSSRQTVDALRRLLPFLMVKAPQARLAIEFQALMVNGKGKPYRLNGWEIAERESYAEALKEAKRGE